MGDNEFVVERILDERTCPKTGGKEYQIKWLKYDEVTWEPASGICHLKQIINEWEKRGTKGRRGRSSSSSNKSATNETPKTSKASNISASTPTTLKRKNDEVTPKGKAKRGRSGENVAVASPTTPTTSAMAEPVVEESESDKMEEEQPNAHVTNDNRIRILKMSDEFLNNVNKGLDDFEKAMEEETNKKLACQEQEFKDRYLILQGNCVKERKKLESTLKEVTDERDAAVEQLKALRTEMEAEKTENLVTIATLEEMLRKCEAEKEERTQLLNNVKGFFDDVLKAGFVKQESLEEMLPLVREKYGDVYSRAAKYEKIIGIVEKPSSPSAAAPARTTSASSEGNPDS